MCSVPSPTPRRGRLSRRSCLTRPAPSAISWRRTSARWRRRAARNGDGPAPGFRCCSRDSCSRRKPSLVAPRRSSAFCSVSRLQPPRIGGRGNLALATRQRGGGGGQENSPNPPPPPPQSGGGGQQPQPPPPPSGGGQMSESQADQVLRSIGQEELRTRRDRTGRTRRAAPAGVKDW